MPNALLFVDFICASILLVCMTYSVVSDAVHEFETYLNQRKINAILAIQKRAVEKANRLSVPVSDGRGMVWFPGGTTATFSDAPYLAEWKYDWRLTVTK